MTFDNKVGVIRAENVDGKLRLDTSSGAISVTGGSGEVVADTGSGEIEVSAMDADLGPVFYNLVQDPAAAGLDRQGSQCLRCHDSYSMTGGGVPRFILGSGYTHESGNLVSHEGWILTSPETPLRFRWGGWYVTGSHGNQVHLGNIVVRNTADLYDLEAIRKGNLEDLSGLVDTGRYLSPHSDIVALLVLEHQVHVQNLLTRVNYDARAALARKQENAGAGERIPAIVEPLVKAMLMSGEVPLSEPVSGTSGGKSGPGPGGTSGGASCHPPSITTLSTMSV